jgi:hypothetical protein
MTAPFSVRLLTDFGAVCTVTRKGAGLLDTATGRVDAASDTVTTVYGVLNADLPPIGTTATSGAQQVRKRAYLSPRTTAGATWDGPKPADTLAIGGATYTVDLVTPYALRGVLMAFQADVSA